MADLGIDSLGQFIPSGAAVSSFFTGALGVITIIVIAIIVILLLGLGVYVFLQYIKYNKKIKIFEEVNGRMEETKQDRAMELSYGRSGDTVFYLKKRKKYLPRPEIQTGRRTYWYFIREDGEWINIGLENVNLMMKQANVKFLHPEMRYARTSLLKSLKDRYDKPKLWTMQNIVAIGLIGAMIVACVFQYLTIDKWFSIGDKVNSMIETSGKVMEKADKVVAGLANICTGSGIKAG